MSTITLNLAITMLLLVQWVTVALASEETILPTINPMTVTIEEMPKRDLLLNSSRGIMDTEDIDNPSLKTADFLRGHSHKPPPANLTGPLDLRVNTTTPTSITLQWRLNPEMKERIIKYRIHYVHQNFPDVKTIMLVNDGTYELTGLGK